MKRGVEMVAEETARKEKEPHLLVKMPTASKRWLEEESRRTGRSQTWLVNHALGMWMDRLKKSRGEV